MLILYLDHLWTVKIFVKLHQNKEGNILNHIYYLQTIKADDPFTLLTIVLALVIWKRIHNVTHNMKRKVLMKRMKIHTKCRGKTNLCNAFIVVFVIHNRSISDSEFSEYTRLNQSGCLISLSNYVSIYVRVIGIIRSKFQYFPR